LIGQAGTQVSIGVADSLIGPTGAVAVARSTLADLSVRACLCLAPVEAAIFVRSRTGDNSAVGITHAIAHRAWILAATFTRGAAQSTGTGLLGAPDMTILCCCCAVTYASGLPASCLPLCAKINTGAAIVGTFLVLGAGANLGPHHTAQVVRPEAAQLSSIRTTARFAGYAKIFTGALSLVAGLLFWTGSLAGQVHASILIGSLTASDAAICSACRLACEAVDGTLLVRQAALDTATGVADNKTKAE